MTVGRTDGSYDAFSNPSDNRLFAGSADQSVNICPDGNFGFSFQFNAVFSNSGNNGCFDNFRIDAHLNGF
ncbi:hypothetical protein SDC9_206011 [bioreactor metagenome]|uniref:Uncharacterized protein n=1 Tax=bioreactor metagenome TaxID=1076179 RepID=A0A645J3T0_9ZZZZ